MSRTIMFSRYFPQYHPRKNQPTHFVEKIYNGLINLDIDYSRIDVPMSFLNSLSEEKHDYKYHTIRAGNRWKVGEKFSPRVWGGKPYNSKQIIIAPDIEIKKVITIEIINQKIILNGVFFGEYARGFYDDNVATLANNDGLSLVDFENWFGSKFFQGQVIVWNENINY